MKLARVGGRADAGSDVDLNLVSDLLVSPLLARMAQGSTGQLEPARASRQITDLVLAGAAPAPASPN